MDELAMFDTGGKKNRAELYIWAVSRYHKPVVFF